MSEQPDPASWRVPAQGSAAPAGPGRPPQAPEPSEDERTWAVLVHTGGVFLGPLPALVVRLAVTDRSAFVRSHAIAALDFQLYLLLAWVLVLGLVWLTAWIAVAVLLVPVLAGLHVVLPVLAAITAQQGREHRYPRVPRIVP